MQAETRHRSLVARVRSGDLEAFGELIEEFQAPTRAFIAMLGIPAGDVEDLAQEAFLLAYRNLDRFDPGRSFGPWLRGIARNLVRRFHEEAAEAERRRQKSLRSLLARQEVWPDEETYADRFRLKFLKGCLEKLSPAAALILRRTYSEGRRSAQIAREVGLTPDAVRMSLSRIRMRLKECVDRRITLENS